MGASKLKLELFRAARWLAPLVLGVLTTTSLSLAEESSDELPTSDKAAVESASGTSEVPVNDEELATARLHFANGVELLQADPPNYQDAYQQFQLALAKSGRSWKVLGNLAFCALKLERDGEALEYYEEYLRRGGDDIDPREKTSIERETLLARGNLATVTIESSASEARISVRRQGSNAPVQVYRLEEGKTELGLRSGTLTITAQAAGKVLEWSPVVSPGESVSHVFDFSAPSEKTPGDSGTGATTTASTDPAMDAGSGGGLSTLQLAGIVTAGVGVIALGGGAVLGIMSQSKESAARDDCIENTCQTATEDDFDSAKSMATVANVLFISGGVLAAAGVTLVIVGSDQPSGEAVRHSNASQLALSPLTLPGGGGLLAHGRF
jgi:hypothetical protein